MTADRRPQTADRMSLRRQDCDIDGGAYAVYFRGFLLPPGELFLALPDGENGASKQEVVSAHVGP